MKDPKEIIEILKKKYPYYFDEDAKNGELIVRTTSESAFIQIIEEIQFAS